MRSAKSSCENYGCAILSVVSAGGSGMVGRSEETDGQKGGVSGEDHRVLHTEQLPEEREMDPSAEPWEDYRVQSPDEEICVIVTPSPHFVVL